MEKRLLLSVVLSFIVLGIWNTFIQPPEKTKQIRTEEVLPSESEKNLSISNQIDKKIISSEQKTSDLVFVEEIRTLELEKLSVTFSNKGGQIKEILVRDYNYTFPIDKIASIPGFDKKFEVTKWEQNVVQYSFQDDNLTLHKIYRFDSNEYLFDIEVILENHKSLYSNDLKLNALVLEMSKFNDQNGQKHDFGRDKALHEYFINSDKEFFRKSNAHKFEEKHRNQILGPNNFVGFRDRYFSFIFKPEFSVSQTNVTPGKNYDLNIGYSVETSENVSSFTAKVYAGPEEYSELKKHGLGFEKVKKYYRFFLFDWVGKVIFHILHFLHTLIPNWGICIILISLIVYGATAPLTIKGMKSMKKMQEIQPQIVALKEKYKNDSQKMNLEMMAIYQKNQINPLSGCLPFLIQMPVFIGLYQVLWRDVSFKGANFLWINDLSEPDRFAQLPVEIPFLGSYLNLLPLIMMGIMFVQQRFSMKNMVAATPEQAMQQKIMAKIMPLFIGVIFYNFSSGLTLYFTFYYALSTITQWKVSQIKGVPNEQKVIDV